MGKFLTAFGFILILSNQVDALNLNHHQQQKLRVEGIVHLIRTNTTYNFKPLYHIRIKESNDANAWSLGPHFIVTTKLLEILNDQDLTAVIAHEMAHREQGHIFTRIAIIAGGAIAVLLEKIEREEELSFSKEYAGFQEDYKLTQEMEADCMAYAWLKELNQKGFDVKPINLNTARNVMFDMNFDKVDPEYYDDLPPYIRHMNIKKGC